MAKITDEQLRSWRAMGVKSVGFIEGEMATVEFFPVSLLDVGSLVPGDPESTPTDRPPPRALGDQEEDAPPLKRSAALDRVLRKSSVS